MSKFVNIMKLALLTCCKYKNSIDRVARFEAKIHEDLMTFIPYGVCLSTRDINSQQPPRIMKVF